LGTREDEPAKSTYPGAAQRPHSGLAPVRLAHVLAHPLTGYVPKAFTYPYEGEIPPQYQASARMTFFDNAVDRYLAGIVHFVILGAGFDTRAFRLPKETPVRSFELDAPRTQAVKREAPERAGIDSTNVTFVAADFEKEDWLTRLVDSGFDPGKRFHGGSLQNQ
jgi:methyltransferase (TIGR00027 family)